MILTNSIVHIIFYTLELQSYHSVKHKYFQFEITKLNDYSVTFNRV